LPRPRTGRDALRRRSRRLRADTWRYDPKELAKFRMAIGNCISVVWRAPKGQFAGESGALRRAISTPGTKRRRPSLIVATAPVAMRRVSSGLEIRKYAAASLRL
jgi:hypothetical protein